MKINSDTIIIIRVQFLTWHTKYEKRKALLEKDLNEELMPVAWHPIAVGLVHVR